MKRITVLLAEDHTVVREGFRKLLELEDDFEVVGEAEDGRQAVAMVKKLCPAVVIMDIAMPVLNGLEATRQILKAVPGTRILILSAHSDDAYVKNATESGAMGFLLLWQAHLADRRLQEIYRDHRAQDAKAQAEILETNRSAAFYFGKIASARFFINQVLTLTHGRARAIMNNDKSALEIPEYGFALG